MLTFKIGSAKYQFKNYREAHYELDLARVCNQHGGCEASRLEHYSDRETIHDDFGRLIGKECVDEYFSDQIGKALDRQKCARMEIKTT